MQGEASGRGGPTAAIEARLLVIASPYYADVTQALREGVEAVAQAHGTSLEHVEVPGALEIPQALLSYAQAARFTSPTREPTPDTLDGVVVLGCVIRGETSHYDIVCNETNHFMMQTAMAHEIPLGNAVLTVDTHAQAMARAQGGAAGKGGDAARACLRLIEINRALQAEAKGRAAR
ncbi:MAG: 6,7-dimethyl-8-ribityllumazine synthase [Pseudomonadota bacterium]